MMYKLRDKQTPYWFTNDEESRILKSLGAVFLEKGKRLRVYTIVVFSFVRTFAP